MSNMGELISCCKATTPGWKLKVNLRVVIPVYYPYKASTEVNPITYFVVQ